LRLSRFGYISLFEAGEDKAKEQKERIRAHEFHYWDSTAPGNAMHAGKPLSARGWDCMYHTDRLLAGFPHLYYRSGPELIRSFLKGANER
jgi:cobyrinic acid a,c-diamide synthase